MNWFASLIAVVAGLTNPLQAGANSELTKDVGPVATAVFVYGTGALLLLFALPILGAGDWSREKFATVPVWAWVGGLCNVVYLLSAATMAKKLGSGTFTTIVVVTAIVVSIALDHFGLMGFEQRQATAGRLVGAALAVAGIICVARF